MLCTVLLALSLQLQRPVVAVRKVRCAWQWVWWVGTVTALAAIIRVHLGAQEAGHTEHQPMTLAMSHDAVSLCEHVEPGTRPACCHRHLCLNALH